MAGGDGVEACSGGALFKEGHSGVARGHFDRAAACLGRWNVGLAGEAGEPGLFGEVPHKGVVFP